MGHLDHRRRAEERGAVRFYVLTVSDTRTEATDSGGETARELIRGAGHEVAGSAIVRDEPLDVGARVRRLVDERAADVIVTTGGTGISPRDSTYEALAALLGKRLDGFGELFRALSFQEIGAAAMMSRAVGGLVAGPRGSVALFALPGSPAAVRLGLEKLILPEAGHLVFEASKVAGGAHP